MASSPAQDLTPVYQAAAQEWNVDPRLLQSVASVESGGTPNPDQAFSSAGAQGRMQIMPGTAHGLGVTDPNDPVQNIYGGAKYLSQMLDKYKTPELALAAYNAGPDRVDAYLAGKAPLPDQTTAYIPKVGQRYAAMAQPQQPASASPAPTAASGPSPSMDPFTSAFTAAQPQGASSPAQQATTPAQPDPFTDAFTAAQKGASPQTTAPADAQAAPLLSQTVAPHLAPDGSGQMTNLSDADFAKFMQRANAPPDAAPVASGAPPAAPPTPPAPPTFWQNAGAGIVRGLQDVPDALNRGAAYVDRNVPILGALDRSLGGNVQGEVDAQPAAQAAYDQRYGNSLTADVGRFAGNTLASLPFMAVGGAAAGAVGEGLGAALPDSVGALNALRSTNAVTRAVGTGLQAAGTGAAYGGAQAALTGGNPLTGAEVGATLGPVASTAMGVPGAARGAYNGLKSVGSGVANMLSSKGAISALDQEIDSAIANAGGSTAAPTAPGARTEPPSLLPASAPSSAPGAPNSAGAAASSANDLAANAMTPAQAEASRATGFNYRLSQQATPGFDNTEYVPGSKPTLAEQIADPALAAQQRVIAPGNPDFANLDRANNEARLDHFDNMAGTPTTVETLKAARSAQADADLTAAFGSKGTADAQPVLDHIHDILSGPDGKRGAVRSALSDVAAGLRGDDGTLETDPEMLYGVRKHITDLMSKQGQMSTPLSGRVVGQLQSTKDALDAAIEKAAPGYGQYLSNFAAASRPIEAQELLQGFRPNLLDAKGNMQLSRVNTMMKSIGQQMASPGVNPAKSLSDDTVDQLFNLRQDLLRQDNRNLARPAGSDTFHNQTVGNEIGMNALSAGAHVLASHVPGGNLLVGPALSSAVRSTNAKVRAHLTNRLLTAEPLEPIYGNPLSAPSNPLSAP